LACAKENDTVEKNNANKRKIDVNVFIQYALDMFFGSV